MPRAAARSNVRMSEQPSSKGGRARVVEANRSQIEWRAFDLDALIAADHRARTVVAAVDRFDLSDFYAEVQSREGQPGRPPFDPRVLMALWLYAISEGVG